MLNIYTVVCMILDRNTGVTGETCLFDVEEDAIAFLSEITGKIDSSVVDGDTDVTVRKGEMFSEYVMPDKTIYAGIFVNRI